MADGGIYGDMLSAFPELIRTYTVFDMEAKTGGGYNARRNLREVDGIFRRVPGGKMGIAGENREPNEVGTFWIYDDDADRVRQGSFVEIDGDLLVLTKDNGYLREGGFTRFTAALVGGPNDQQVEDPVVVEKALNDYQ